MPATLTLDAQSKAGWILRSSQIKRANLVRTEPQGWNRINNLLITFTCQQVVILAGGANDFKDGSSIAPMEQWVSQYITFIQQVSFAHVQDAIMNH